jgi:hypothetical protein
MRYELYKDLKYGYILIRELESKLEVGSATSLMISHVNTTVNLGDRERSLLDERNHHAFIECEINCVTGFVPLLDRTIELVGGMPECSYDPINITYNPELHSSFIERNTKEPCKPYYRGGFVSAKLGVEFYL